MRPLDDAELADMAGEMESDRVERKESLRGDAPTKVREAICAFANDLAGHSAPGIVIVGLRDSGAPVENFQVTDEILLQLADMKSDGSIVPLPSLLVEKRRFDPVRCKGAVTCVGGRGGGWRLRRTNGF